MTDDDTGPLVSRSGFATTDPSQAEEFLSATYVDQRLRLSGPRENFTAAVSSLDGPGLAISRLQTGAGLTHTVDETPGDVLIVSAPASGRISYLDNAYRDVHTLPGTAVLSPPSGGVHVESNDLDITIVTLDRHRVATYVATVLGLDEVAPTFHDLAPLSPVMARFWTDTVTQVRDDVLADPWVSLQPIPVAQAFHTVAAALLSAFPNTVLDHVTDPDAPAPRGDVSAARLREVVDYLDAHADQPIGPDDVAGLAGAPASEVTASLRRRYGTHPAALLWRARLRGVHRDLLDADPDTARPVEHHAARWGFTRPTQFRVAYRWAFDETPGDTLKR